MDGRKYFMTGISALIKKLENLDFQPSVKIALEKTMPRMVKDVQDQMRDDLDNPTPDAINAIQYTIEKGRNGYVGKLYIDREHVRYLYPNIFSVAEDDASGGREIVEPVNIDVDTAGNIVGLGDGRLTTLRLNTADYLNVPLGRSQEYNGLPEGLYRRVKSPGNAERLIMLLAYSYSRQTDPHFMYFEAARDSVEAHFMQCLRNEIRRQLRS